MHNPYLAEATALLTEAAQELPEDATAAAAIKASMAQAYATLSLAQESRCRNRSKIHNTQQSLVFPSPPCN
ncbi:hypothetical protein ACETK3_19715 [Arthrobacter sp. E44]|uniref:hypothetical protein n=1 Tax=Arthrobacter sp. E44 TaxID=3341794 RepID=UPI0035A6316B